MDALTISVVVPVLDDTAALTTLLGHLRAFWPRLEIVVSDGGADGGARMVAELFGARWIPSPPGRGVQMNRGAAAARGEILWFLHADSAVLPGSLEAMQRALRDPAVIAGAFAFRLAARHWYAPLLNGLVALRSRWFCLPFGDQGLFVRRGAFHALGGYHPLPILEDVEFVRRLCGAGRVAFLDHPIGVSARRWEAEGFIQATLRNWAVEAGWMLGMPAARLARWYRPPTDPAARHSPRRAGGGQASPAGNLHAHAGVRVA